MPARAELIPTRDGTGTIVGFALNAGRVRDLAFTRSHPQASPRGVVDKTISCGTILLTVGVMLGTVQANQAGQPTDTFLRSERWLDPISGELKGPVIIQVTGERTTSDVDQPDCPIGIS